MSAIESIKYFIDLLQIDPIWIKLILLALVIKCFYPWNLTEKIETEEKDGKIISKIFHI